MGATQLNQLLVRSLMTSLPHPVDSRYLSLSHFWPRFLWSYFSSPGFQKTPAFLFQLLIPALPQVAGMTAPSPSGAELCTPVSCLGFLLIRGRARVSSCSSLSLDLPISMRCSTAFPQCQSCSGFCKFGAENGQGRREGGRELVWSSSANSFPWADIALKTEANSFQLCPATPGYHGPNAPSVFPS